MSVSGKSLPVIDASARVRGSIEFVLDLELPRMAFGRIVRSPHPHARLIGIDASRARALPGVVAVLTGEDLPHALRERRYGRFFLDQSVLAVDRVRYIGEPVAAVAAISEDTAVEACGLIEVDYEPLTAVFSVADALDPRAPVLHDPRPKLRDEVRDMIGDPTTTTNLCSYFKLRHGSVEQGFAESDFIVEDTFDSPAVQHVPLEPHVSVARYDSRLTVWTSTQMPHAVRTQLAELFDLPLTQVRVITSNLGGGFGSKSGLRLEPVASLLSGAAGRPVKIVLDRDEEFVTITKHPATVRIKSGVTRAGLLMAREVTAHYNTGAYADVGPMVARNAGSALPGPYRIPHVTVDSYSVWTNLVPAGAFRGFGVTQGAWAYESHTDVIADQIGIDPIEFRRMNLLRPGDRYATGEVVDDVHFERLLDRVVESVGSGSGSIQDRVLGGEDRSPQLRRGTAITTSMKATITPSTSTAAVKLNDDGSLNVLTSSVDLGQGAKTVLAQIAADALSIRYEAVHVSEPDTDLTPYDQQTSSSRTTYSMGNAVLVAAEEVQRQLLDLGSERLEAAVEDLVLSDGGIQVRGVPSKRVVYGEVLRGARRGNLLGKGSFVTQGGLDPETGQGTASVHWHHGAVGCEVEVDLHTGRIEVLQIVAAVFAGRVINPRLCELQVEGSLLFGMGQALFEEMIYDEGLVVNANLSDYMIPSFDDIPHRFHISLVEGPEGGDVHGVGESCLPPVSPAIANAVYNAVGVRLKELPLTPERVLRALESELSAKGAVAAAGVPS
jgi:CO/xanthine dehydrogenase Mo-binding subunit